MKDQNGNDMGICKNCWFMGHVCNFTRTQQITPQMVALLNEKEYTAGKIEQIGLDTITLTG